MQNEPPFNDFDIFYNICLESVSGLKQLEAICCHENKLQFGKCLAD